MTCTEQGLENICDTLREHGASTPKCWAMRTQLDPRQDQSLDERAPTTAEIFASKNFLAVEMSRLQGCPKSQACLIDVRGLS